MSEQNAWMPWGSAQPLLISGPERKRGNSMNEQKLTDLDALTAEMRCGGQHPTHIGNRLADALIAERDRSEQAEKRVADVWDEGARWGFNTTKSNHDWKTSNPYRSEVTTTPEAGAN